MDNGNTPLDKGIEEFLTVLVIVAIVVAAFWWFSQVLHQ